MNASKNRTGLSMGLIAAFSIALSWQANAREFFPGGLVGSWHAFSRTAQRAGNVTISPSKLNFENGMEIELLPVAIRRGVSLAPGDELAELFKISSIRNPPKSSEPIWGKPGSYLSAYWRNFNPYEKWMLQHDKNLHGEILYITLLTSTAGQVRQLDSTSLQVQASYTYVR
ncbi:MAG TPA: hypothetical protein VGL35_08110 [Rhizomicrobium sp.]|jgi:hypothetical protein